MDFFSFISYQKQITLEGCNYELLNVFIKVNLKK
jgi:hypothetical protein